MKKLILALVLLCGCGSLHENYVRQDRANYETLAPRIRKMMTTTTEYTPVQQADIEDRLQGWDAKTLAALESLEKGE